MIDYRLLHNSTVFYQKLGFQRIESPWTVTKAVSEITKPAGAKEFALQHEDGKVLVASGEQSFLYLYLKNFLPKGKFQTITPCFRHNSFDSLHSKYFVKNELIITDDVSLESLDFIIKSAKDFFTQYLNKEPDIRQISKNQFDIEFNGVELGSYGVRSCDYLRWIYGTGIAEPRLSSVMYKNNIGV